MVSLTLFHTNQIWKNKISIKCNGCWILAWFKLSIFQKIPSVLMHFRIHGPSFEGLVFEAAKEMLSEAMSLSPFSSLGIPCLLTPSPFSSE